MISGIVQKDRQSAIQGRLHSFSFLCRMTYGFILFVSRVAKPLELVSVAMCKSAEVSRLRHTGCGHGRLEA